MKRLDEISISRMLPQLLTTDSGNVPVNMLSKTRNDSKAVHCPIVVGSDPDKALLFAEKETRRFQRPIVAGKVPLIEFSSKWTRVRKFNKPKSGGI
jgi:hypothetical protein